MVRQVISPREVLPPASEDNVRPKMFWNTLLGEVQTRVLLLYISAMLGLTAIAVPIFRYMLFESIDQRVRGDLREELIEFQDEYDEWVTEENPTPSDLQSFIDDFLMEGVPEDDNYHIFILDKQFYMSNPSNLPELIDEDSELMQYWRDLENSDQTDEIKSSNAVLLDAAAPIITRGEKDSNDPQVGNVLYKVVALKINEQHYGSFVVAHLTAGERAEALTGVYIFAQVAFGVVISSFFVAWLGTRQLFAPVRSLATAARSIGEANLSQRLEVHGKGELADLASTFNSMMNRLENAFESQRNFVNDASHELRTPITIIQGHLELMGDDPAEQEETLELVMDELDRMARFVNDLILLAKSERPDFLQLETIDVESFTNETYQKAVALAPRNWQLQMQNKGKMVGDRQRLAGALINLINNAVQHTKENDTIEIGVAIEQGKVSFWVRDTGEGITKKDQARIFERFARAANSYRRSEGAGLGLSITKAIIEAHGGHVELTSQVEQGATFTLVMPLEIPIEQEAQATS